MTFVYFFLNWFGNMRLDIQLINVMGDLEGCAYEIDTWQFQTFLQHIIWFWCQTKAAAICDIFKWN